ncbi:hypothetical protein LINGRAHAP2_LOCUS8440 [Linum grandiflorum]
MAAFGSLSDMNDPELKHRILRTLLKEDVPDEKKPFDKPSNLKRVVSRIQTHKLLSECFSETMNQKLIGRWKSAVDDWVNRLLSLVSNLNMPDKSWAGICLLGVTSQECSSERFAASYAVWFDKLLVSMQASIDSQFIKVASCASMSDLITRLAGFPKLKKDGLSCAGKLIQPLLKMLDEDSPETVQETALHLLCTIINLFPASLPRYYDTVETAIASRMLSGNGSLSVKKKFASALALLPKSRGDEESWLLLIRRTLLLLNGYLTDVFDGLEEASKWEESVRLLVPPGEVPPQMIWGQKLVEKVSGKDRRRSKLSSALLLMYSCSVMLTNSHPNQVHVPVCSLLAVVERVLMVHGSLPNAMAFVIAAEQEYVCSELPLLHSYSLEILSSVIKGMRSQLMPHAAYIVRLVKSYFKRCQLPVLRQKVYEIAKMLLISMGVGVAIYLAQEVVNNALIDLTSGADHTTIGRSNVSSQALLQPCSKKRKHGGTDAIEQQQNSIAMEFPLVDYKGRQGNDGRSFLSNEHAPMHPDFQLAALKALLASLLSPSRSRPPHLAQSLELFRRDSLSVNSLPGFKDSASQRPSTQFPLSNDEAEDGGRFSLNDDMLYQSWIDNSKGTEGSIEIVERQTNIEEEIVERQTNIEEETDAAARVETDAEAGNAKADTMIGNDEIMVDLVQADATVPQVNEIVSAGVDKVDVARESYDNAAEITGSDAAMEHQSEDLHPNKFAILGSPKKRTVTGAESDTDSSESFPEIVFADPDSDSGGESDCILVGKAEVNAE